MKTLGGVSNHYAGLKMHWKSDVTYNQIGSRFSIPGIFLLPIDLLTFTFKLLYLKPSLVLLNPSFNRAAFYRDALYLKVASILRFKTIVFFHGWSSSFEDKVNTSVFNKYYGKAAAFIVLAQGFKKKILSWSPQKPTYLSSTKVDNDLLTGFTMDIKPTGHDLIFLGRIQKEKGIYIVLDTFKKIQQEYKTCTLNVVGDGAELNKAITYAKQKNIMNVIFHGRLSGVKLAEVLKNTNINIFPTFHGEGMPTSVLEAMAFGLAVITRPIGGMPDFFEEGKMGYLTTSLDPTDYLKKFKQLLEVEANILSVGKYNFDYAKQHFYASKVAQDLERIFLEVMG